jgi:hypothetical protein
VASFALYQFNALPRSFRDGTSNTIMFAEVYRVCGGASPTTQRTRFWGATAGTGDGRLAAFNRAHVALPNATVNIPQFQIAPRPYSGGGTTASFAVCSSDRPQTPHSGGMLICLGDGSVRGLQGTVSLTTWRFAVAPADGNVLPSDW